MLTLLITLFGQNWAIELKPKKKCISLNRSNGILISRSFSIVSYFLRRHYKWWQWMRRLRKMRKMNKYLTIINSPRRKVKDHWIDGIEYSYLLKTNKFIDHPVIIIKHPMRMDSHIDICFVWCDVGVYSFSCFLCSWIPAHDDYFVEYWS